MTDPNERQREHYLHLVAIGLKNWQSITVGQYSIVYHYAIDHRHTLTERNRRDVMGKNYLNIEQRAENYYNLLMRKAKRYEWGSISK